MHFETRNKIYGQSTKKAWQAQRMNGFYTKPGPRLEEVNRTLQKDGMQNSSPVLPPWWMLTRCLGTKITRQPQGSAVSVLGASEEWGRDNRRFELKGDKLARRRRRLIFCLEIANMDVVSIDCKCMHCAEFWVIPYQGKQTIQVSAVFSSACIFYLLECKQTSRY